jgi:hypothetical protein
MNLDEKQAYHSDTAQATIIILFLSSLLIRDSFRVEDFVKIQMKGIRFIIHFN